jgi:NAD(P)H-nitrite reductase large subunit
MSERYLDYLIIGGGPAGTNAAEAIRRRDRVGSIAIVTNESHPLYIRPSLAFYMRGLIQRDQLFQKKIDFYTKNSIELITDKKVIRVSAADKKAFLEDEDIFSYKKLLIATGGRPRRWQIPGAGLEGVYYLRTLNDAEAMMNRMRSSKKAIVIGGGFLGMDLNQTFRISGLEVVNIIREKVFWSHFLDENGGRLIERILRENGIDLISEDEVVEVLGNKTVTGIRTAGGKQIDSDIVGVGIGIGLNLDLLDKKEVEIKRGIIVDDHLRSSSPDLFAAGDVAEFNDPIMEKRHIMGNWSNAMAHGKVAGANMAGEDVSINVVSSYQIDIWGRRLTAMGDTAMAEGTRVFIRDQRDQYKYGRIFVRDGVIKGAILIDLKDLEGPLSTLIKEKREIKNLELLSDPAFDLKGLL